MWCTFCNRAVTSGAHVCNERVLGLLPTDDNYTGPSIRHATPTRKDDKAAYSGVLSGRRARPRHVPH